MNRVNPQGIIYKNNNGDWENAAFSTAMKKLCKTFREKILWLSKKYKIEFSKEIPE